MGTLAVRIAHDEASVRVADGQAKYGTKDNKGTTFTGYLYKTNKKW